MRKHIVIDINLSPEWVAEIEKNGWEAAHWSSIGSLAASDEEILAWARSNSSIVFTHDLDFGTILALTKAKGPSVIQIRGRKVLPEEAGPLVATLLSRYLDELLRGVLIAVDENKARVRLLPIF